MDDGETIKTLSQGAWQRAEQLHRRLASLHELAASKRSFDDSWQQILHLLEDAELSETGREDLSGASLRSGLSVKGAILNGIAIRESFEFGLAKTLLALWLYFDLACADSAEHVRSSSLLSCLLCCVYHLWLLSVWCQEGSNANAAGLSREPGLLQGPGSRITSTPHALTCIL